MCLCLLLLIVVSAQPEITMQDVLLKVLMSSGDDVHDLVDEAFEIASIHGAWLSPHQTRLLCGNLGICLVMRRYTDMNYARMEESWTKLHFICDKLV